MIAHSAWIRWGVLAAAMTFLAAGSGCGGGGGVGYYGPSGTLEVENYVLSTDVVEGIDVQQVVGTNFYSYNVFLIPGEFIALELFPDAYDVTIYWGDGSVDFLAADVYDGVVTTLTVSN